MTWKSLLPLYGKITVRKKVSELEDEAGTLPIMFGMLFAKAIEQLAVFNFSEALRFFMASVVVAAMYIYRHEAKKKAKEVKEEVTE